MTHGAFTRFFHSKMGLCPNKFTNIRLFEGITPMTVPIKFPVRRWSKCVKWSLRTCAEK